VASFFDAEKGVPENRPRQNFVFMAYPFQPALPADDYRAAVKELQAELPIRFWYFLDEHTTAELMRKIWRAIIRADIAVFDISDGNPNVALELGLALAHGRRCVTMLKTGTKNPLGNADLGYSERIEYDSIKSLKEQLRKIVTSKSSGLGTLRGLSYEMGDNHAEIYERLRAVTKWVFDHKSITKDKAVEIYGDASVTGKLREKGVLEVQGKTKAAKWVFTDLWVNHDHEVSGEEF